MARDWILSNRNQGNVLKAGAEELTFASAITIQPNANHSYYRVLDATGNITITVDGSKSFPVDELVILIEATNALTLTIAGDGAPGSVAISAGGVGAVKLVNGGSVVTPFFLNYVNLS